MRWTVILLTALAVAGCGEKPEPAASTKPLVLALDFTPNPVHAPIYAAARTAPLRIQRPGSGPDALKLVATGKVDLGVLDIHDLAIAREQGTDLVAIGALVSKPLAALVAQPSVKRPRDLEGKTVGVSGLPSDPAFLKAIVEHDGGDYDRVKQVTIGFSAVSRLLSRRVDAVPAFWNAEGVALHAKGLDVKEFKVEQYGAPAYPEVVFITARKTLQRERAALKAVLEEIAAGVAKVRADPEASVKELAGAAETDDLELMRAQLDAVLPLFDDDLAPDRAVLEKWADFDAAVGIVKARPDVGAAFDLSLVE
jgi:NitT/TauT family transport system substrate-binding protein/putative hydroxymethylpyrimidine transport system substrate-binding protein